MNEQGGNIGIETTGAGELQIIADTVITGTLSSGVITQSGATLANTYQPLDAGLTSLAGLTYASDSFIKVTATDVYAVRTIAQTADDLEGAIDHNNLANTHASNIFSTVAVSGQSNVVADSDTDTLTIVAGTNVTITTDAGADSVTINSAAGGALNDLTDVTITSVGNGEILGYNSGWINRTLAEASIQPLDAGLTSLAALSYVSASFVKMTGANAFALRTIAQTADDLEGTIDHANLANLTIAAHDTTATGANLTSLTDNSIVNTLHRHSELVASDGSPDPALSVDATGQIGIGTATAGALLEINGLTGIVGDGRYSQLLFDDTSLAAGVGGGIAFGGVYTPGGTQTLFAMIWGEKENATDGEWGGELHLGTRVNAGSVSNDIIIDSSGKVGVGAITNLRKFTVKKEGDDIDDGIAIQGDDDAVLWGLISVDANNSLTFGSWTGSAFATNVIIENTSGKVGVGVDPKTKLTIEGTLTLKEQASTSGIWGALACPLEIAASPIEPRPLNRVPMTAPPIASLPRRPQKPGSISLPLRILGTNSEVVPCKASCIASSVAERTIVMVNLPPSFRT